MSSKLLIRKESGEVFPFLTDNIYTEKCPWTKSVVTTEPIGKVSANSDNGQPIGKY